MYIKRLKFKKLFNTRDLGGIPTQDGRVIKSGKLIRSGKLHKIPEETVQAFKKMNVTKVVDLRIDTEREEAPDVTWEGMEYIRIPLLCTATAGITQDKSMRRTMAVESRRINKEFGSADNYMIEMYKTVLLSEDSMPRVAEVMRLIIDNEDCILWHCSGGKDRAGLIAMLVESLLGVDEKIILYDYRRSHYFQRKRFFWNRFGLVIAPLYLRFKRILFGMMAAKNKYMEETMAELKRRYGSVVGYCKTALGITDGDIRKMKDKYLE